MAEAAVRTGILRREFCDCCYFDPQDPAVRNGRKYDRRHMVRHESARLHGRRMDQTDLAKDCAGMGRHVPGRDGVLYGSQRFVADMKDIGGALWHVNS